MSGINSRVYKLKVSKVHTVLRCGHFFTVNCLDCMTFTEGARKLNEGAGTCCLVIHQTSSHSQQQYSTLKDCHHTQEVTEI